MLKVSDKMGDFCFWRDISLPTGGVFIKPSFDSHTRIYNNQVLISKLKLVLGMEISLVNLKRLSWNLASFRSFWHEKEKRAK